MLVRFTITGELFHDIVQTGGITLTLHHVKLARTFQALIQSGQSGAAFWFLLDTPRPGEFPTPNTALPDLHHVWVHQ